MKKIFVIFVFALLCKISFGYVHIPKDSIPGLVLKTAEINNLKSPYTIHPGDTILVSLGKYVWGYIPTRVLSGENLKDVVKRAAYNISDLEVIIRNSSHDMRMDESRKAHAQMETILCSGPWKVVDREIIPQDQSSSEKEDDDSGFQGWSQITGMIFFVTLMVLSILTLGFKKK